MLQTVKPGGDVLLSFLGAFFLALVIGIYLFRKTYIVGEQRFQPSPIRVTPQPNSEELSEKSTDSTETAASTNPSDSDVFDNAGDVKKVPYRKVADWPTYKSSLGFTFQYPPTYSLPKQNPVAYHAYEEMYCEFQSIRLPAGAQLVDSITIIVRPYEGGSRRQFLIDTLALGKSRLLSVEEVEHEGVRGLEMAFQPQFPSWSIRYAAIFIQGSTALMIGNLQRDESYSEWSSMLESLRIESSLHSNPLECPNDWS